MNMNEYNRGLRQGYYNGFSDLKKRILSDKVNEKLFSSDYHSMTQNLIHRFLEMAIREAEEMTQSEVENP